MHWLGIKDRCIDDGIALWPSSVEQKDAADDDEPERSGGNILRSRAEPLSPGAGEHPPTVTLQHPDLLNPPPRSFPLSQTGTTLADCGPDIWGRIWQDRPLAGAISPWPAGGLAGWLGRRRGLALAATGESRVAALPSPSSSSSCPP